MELSSIWLLFLDAVDMALLFVEMVVVELELFVPVVAVLASADW